MKGAFIEFKDEKVIIYNMNKKTASFPYYAINTIYIPNEKARKNKFMMNAITFDNKDGNKYVSSYSKELEKYILDISTLKKHSFLY